MPFGLRNAAQTFQHFIDHVLHGLDFVYAYIDDVLIASSTNQEHIDHLRQVFTQFDEYGIVINPQKCVLGVHQLQFLGHSVSKNGISPLNAKVKVIRDFPTPTSQRQLRKFLGLVNFYHRFIPHCAQILQPLNSCLTPRGKDLQWTSEAAEAFSSIKDALAQATLLSHPQPCAPLAIMTDASDFAIGAVLQQFVSNSWQPISYFSRKLKPSETRYSTFDRELLAIYLSIKHFQHYVDGQIFHILTDHKPLTYSLFCNPHRYSPRQVRHLDFISQFTSDIRHVSGPDNPVADALSPIHIQAIHQVPPVINFTDIATAQLHDLELKHLKETSTSLKFSDIPIEGTNYLLCVIFPQGNNVRISLHNFVIQFSSVYTRYLTLVSVQPNTSLHPTIFGLELMLMSENGLATVFNVSRTKFIAIRQPRYLLLLLQMLDSTMFISIS